MEGIERNFERRNGHVDLYQIGTEATDGEVDVVEREFAADRVTTETEGGEKSCAAACERIEDDVAFVGGG